MAILLLLVLLQQPDPGAEGLKALESRDYAAAEAAFAKAVAAAPGDYAAHFHLALSRSLLGRRDEAVAGYRKTLELKPRLYEAELNLGILLLERKDLAEAAALLRAALETKPAEFRPNFHLAETLLALDDAAGAERHYKTARAADPKSAAAAAGLARAVARQSRLDEAAPLYREAAGLDPGYRPLLLELAALYEPKQPAQAIAIYEQFRDDPAASERLGQLLIESGRAVDAVAPLELAVAQSPTAANRVALATALLRSGQAEKALPALEKAVEESGDPAVRMMYGRVLRDQKKYDAAARQFLTVTQKLPDSREAWSELAAMYNLMGLYPQALAAFDRLQALGENGPALYYFRAIILDRLKQYPAALGNYEAFLRLSEGKHPEEEFKARQRIRILKRETGR
jgi:tetratricopeptide (TPR) repeat protein